jgi:hypothetical protein
MKFGPKIPASGRPTGKKPENTGVFIAYYEKKFLYIEP